MQAFLLVTGVLVLALGCRTFSNPVIRKCGALALLVASFLAGFHLFGESVAAGLAAAASWFLLPWVDILTRIRNLRLPLDKHLRSRRPPPRDASPHLGDYTDEIEDEGFVHGGDTGWDWDDMSQFVRVFYHEESRAQAAIYYNEQRHFAFTYLGVSTRTRDGRVFTTWNYPFANAMRLAPQIHLNRTTDIQSFAQLLDAHQAFLARQQVRAADIQAIDPGEIRPLMEKETRLQVDHNLDLGLIRLSGNGTFRYSWRGLVYLWYQFLKDMVRLS